MNYQKNTCYIIPYVILAICFQGEKGTENTKGRGMGGT